MMDRRNALRSLSLAGGASLFARGDTLYAQPVKNSAIEDLRKKITGRLPLKKQVASGTDFKPHAACHVGSSRFSEGIEVGGVLRSYDHALYFFEAAKRAFSVLPNGHCLYKALATADENAIFDAWQASLALSIITSALKGTANPERDSMQASADALALLVGNGLVHYSGRADMYLSPGIINVLCLAHLLPVWGFRRVDQGLVERCSKASVYEPFEPVHRAVSRLVQRIPGGSLEFDRAYGSLAQASNFQEGLVAGMRIVDLFHLSLVRNKGAIRPSIERLLPENEK